MWDKMESSFRAERSGDPEPSGAREREPVANAGSGRIAFASLRRRWVPAFAGMTM
jgi:hypothetical protein